MKVNIHYPTDEVERTELAHRIANIHADAALQYIEKLSCSNHQKTALVDAIIAAKK